MRILQYVGTSDLMKNPRKSDWVETLASCFVRLHATEPLSAVLLEDLEEISGYDKRNIAKTLASRPGFVRIKNSGRWYYMQSFYNYAATQGNNYFPSDYVPFIQSQLPREVVLDESDTLPNAPQKVSGPEARNVMAFPTQVVEREKREAMERHPSGKSRALRSVPAGQSPAKELPQDPPVLASFAGSTFKSLEPSGGDDTNPGSVHVPVSKLRSDATGIGVAEELKELVSACMENSSPVELVNNWQRLSAFAASLALHVHAKIGHNDA